MKYFDRVKETSTTTGTGNFTLDGAATGFRTFASVLSTNDTCYYCIALQGGSEWEVGLGTYSASNTLTRTTVLSSSNSGSAVNFSAGTKDVFLTVAAQRFGLIDLSGASSDYLLQPGEVASIDFSSVTSLSLHVETEQGLYEMNVIYTSLATTPTNGGISLSPNNTTTATDAIKSQHVDISGTNLTTALELRNTFDIGYAGGINYNHKITTMTAGKSINTLGYFKFNSGAYETHIVTEYWADTSTAWTSLGTIAFPYAQSGKVIVKRIA